MPKIANILYKKVNVELPIVPSDIVISLLIRESKAVKGDKV